MKVPQENVTVSQKGAYGKVHLKKLTGLHTPEFLTIFGGLRTHSLV